MMSVCETVAERLAAGEPLTPDESAHVGRCVDCAHLAEVPALLAAVAREPAPAAGFSSRMQIGARRRLVARKRARIALSAVAAAAVMVAGTYAVTRSDRSRIETQQASQTQRDATEYDPTPVVERAASATEKLVLDLVRVTDVETALEGEAPWAEITRPLDSYRALRDRKGAHR